MGEEGRMISDPRTYPIEICPKFPRTNFHSRCGMQIRWPTFLLLIRRKSVSGYSLRILRGTVCDKKLYYTARGNFWTTIPRGEWRLDIPFSVNRLNEPVIRLISRETQYTWCSIVDENWTNEIVSFPLILEPLFKIIDIIKWWIKFADRNTDNNI